MGYLEKSSMGYSINEDGSITKTANTANTRSSSTPDFIPVSMSKLRGKLGKNMLTCWWLLLILAVHGFLVTFIALSIHAHKDATSYYHEYVDAQRKETIESDYKWDTPEYNYRKFEEYSNKKRIMVYHVVVSLLLVLFLDIRIVPRLLKSFSTKMRVLKGADFIQADLKFNYGYPYIMTNNHVGVLNYKKKKIIIPPDYDYIYWVIPQNVLCAVKDNKQVFFDIQRLLLTNVPSSYYNFRAY